MPRGRIASDMLNFKADTDVPAAKEEHKDGAAKFTLIEPESQKKEDDDSLVRQVHDDFADVMESSKPNFKFTLLLVALFAAVNIGLITLLDNNNKSATSPEAANTARAVMDSVEPKLGDTEAVQKNTVAGKPVLAPQVTEEKPVLDTRAAEGQQQISRTQDKQPVLSRPAVAPRQGMTKGRPASQSLLSIIGKN